METPDEDFKALQREPYVPSLVTSAPAIPTLAELTFSQVQAFIIVICPT